MSKKPITAPEPETEALSPEEVASREAEKAETLARLQSRTRPVDLDLDGPASSEKPEHTPAEIQKLIDEEMARHRVAQESAAMAHKKKLDDLMAQQRQAELHAARQVDHGVKSRLKAATDVAVGPIAVDTRIADRDRAEVQGKAEKIVKEAQQAVADIDEIMKGHGEELDRLARVKDAEWKRGLPTEGNDAHRAYYYANRIPFLIEELNNFVRDVRRGVETMTQGLRSLVDSAPVPFGEKNTNRYYMWVREFNQAVHDLGHINGGTVATVNGKISNLVGYVTMLNDLKAMYKGSPQAAALMETESPTAVIRKLERENPNRPRPDVAERLIDHDIFKS